MRKPLLSLIIWLTITPAVIGQRSKSVFIELGGNGVFLSANYDARFAKKENGFGFRAGIGFVPGFNDAFESASAALTIPVGINHLAGKGPHYFESGLGVTYIPKYSSSFLFMKEEARHLWAIVPSIGYRYGRTGRHFQGRVVLSPFIAEGAGIWVGLSAGYRFK